MRRKNHFLYSTWVGMRTRCNNPNATGYKNYGGRGIRVCKRWDNFWHFVEDMGNKPSSEHTLDRVDNDKNYTPSNCKWSTRLEQTRNRRKLESRTGVEGISLESGKYKVRIISHKDSNPYIGCFETLEDAEKNLDIAKVIYKKEGLKALKDRFDTKRENKLGSKYLKKYRTKKGTRYGYRIDKINVSKYGFEKKEYALNELTKIHKDMQKQQGD